MMAEGGILSNEELFHLVQSHGLAAGPVTDTTRPLYERQLKRIRERGSGHQDESRPVKRAKSDHVTRRTTPKGSSSIGHDIIPGLANFNMDTETSHTAKPLRDQIPRLPERPSPNLRLSSPLVINDRPHLLRENMDTSASGLNLSRDRTPLYETPPHRHSTPTTPQEEELMNSGTSSRPNESSDDSSLLSGVFRWIGEGVKEGVKNLVHRVSDVVEVRNKRKPSWSHEDFESPRVKRQRLVPSSPPIPSAPPAPAALIPPSPSNLRPSAPPKPVPSAPPKPVPSAPPKLVSFAPVKPVLVAPPIPSDHTHVQYDWELLPTDVQICLRPDGTQWTLGKGGFGQVYKGLKDGVDEVAVKVIQLVNPSAINQFKLEIDLISKLRHKHILQFYGACIKPSFLYMVTELMQSDLFSALRTDRRYQWSGAYGKDVLVGIASGLHYLHSRRPPVVHRDIKSPNILLMDNVAKIADVGIARTKMQSDMTAQRGFTVAWAAPEVVYRRRATEKIDIWSLGIILWEIVTGKLPGPGQLVLPLSVRSDLKGLYTQCTMEDYSLRPSAADVLVSLKNMS